MMQAGALFLPRRLWEKRRDPVFKPQGNSIIPKRKFVMTFQKRRARRGAKAVNKKRRGRVYAGARKMVQGESVEACGKTTGGAAAQAVRRCSRSARFAAGAPPYSAAVFLPIRRFHFRAYVPAAAIKLFRVQAVGSLSGVYSQKCFNRISKNARLWAYAADVENLSFQQYPYFFQ